MAFDYSKWDKLASNLSDSDEDDNQAHDPQSLFSMPFGNKAPFPGMDGAISSSAFRKNDSGIEIHPTDNSAPRKVLTMFLVFFS